MPRSNFQPIRLFHPDLMTQIHILNDSVDVDQLAPEEANRSGSTPFAKVGHIQVQQDHD